MSHRYRPKRWRGSGLGGIPPEFDAYRKQIRRNVIVRRFGHEPAVALPARLIHSGAFAAEVGFSPHVAEDEGIPFDPDGPAALDDAPASGGKSRAALGRRWSQYLRAGPEARRPPALPSPLGRNVKAFGSAFGLDRAETELLGFALAVEHCPDLAELLGMFPVRRHDDLSRVAADALCRPVHLVRRRLDDDAPLMSMGLVDVTHDGDGWTFEVDRRIAALLFEPRITTRDVLARYFPEEPEPTLAEEDFAHVKDLDLVVDLVRRAQDARAQNVHLAFIGDVGTGKNEMARLVARLTGSRLFLASAPGMVVGAPGSRQRFTSILAAYRTLRGQRAIVLVDEFGDLFAEHEEEWAPRPYRPDDGPLSKLSVNRLMENAPLVTIWICNPGPWLQPSQLRRFAAVVHFRRLGERQLRAIVERQAGAELPSDDLDRLAREYPVSPAEMASAFRTARLLGGGRIARPALERILSNAVKAIPGRRPAPALRAGKEYLIDAVNASIDLRALADRLAGWTRGAGPGPGLCLHGVSGSGKSEFLHHLARRMDRKLIVKRVADVEHPLLGMTERNIEDAFQEADEDDALLLFDEVDSWLRDRRGATHQWELSIANQFLQSLEAHRGIVGVTTNLYDQLDPAVMRRLTYKIRFLPVRPEQALALFVAHLARFLDGPLEEPERAVVLAALARLPGLVPGDFASVARRFALEGAPTTAEALLAALGAERSARSDGRRRPIGFA